MPKRPHRHVRPSALVALLVVALLGGVAMAQIDDRARALLEGMAPEPGTRIDTLDQTMIMTIEGEGEMSVRSRTIVDYPNRRALIESELMPGMNVVIVVQDGDVQMRMGAMTLPLPPGLGEEFADLFDADPNDPLEGIESASFDGPTSYAGLVSGDQVTVRGSTTIAGVDADDDVRLLFDADGGLLGVVAEADGETMLTVFDSPVRGSPALGQSALMYMLDGDEAYLFATLRFEEVRVNEPIDDGLF